MKQILIAALLVCCCISSAEASVAQYAENPAIRQVILRDAALGGAQAAALNITDARASHGYGSITWNSGQTGGVYIYKLTTAEEFPDKHLERYRLVGKYDRMPEPCSLRESGVDPIAAFFITGDEEPGLCEPRNVIPGMHTLFTLSLSKAKWDQKDIVAREITIAGNHALVELDRNRGLFPKARFSQGFKRDKDGNWMFAAFTADVCRMADARVPWNVAQTFIHASARIAYELEGESMIPHGAHCADDYDARLRAATRN